MKYFPYKNDGMYLEDDFRWIRDWGFNFVRLPVDYRFWTDPGDMMTIEEKKVEPIDRAIRLGENYGLHVSLCLQRAPGYCALDELNPAVGPFALHDLRTENLPRVHVTFESTNLFRDHHALEAFAHQWEFFAQRYKGIPGERLSFNLLRSPTIRLTRKGEHEYHEYQKHDLTAANNRMVAFQETVYVRVARVAIHVIRAIDPARVVVSDGCDTFPVSDLIEYDVVQSNELYFPTDFTEYRAEWLPAPDRTVTYRSFDEPASTREGLPIPRGTAGKQVQALAVPRPSWPVEGSRGQVIWDRRTIEFIQQPWERIERQGARIHYGEMGCYKYTPHRAVLAWFKDALAVIGHLHSGWALWNFRGPFGVLDTERKGTKFEEWHGHQLDRALLNLLQKNVRF